MAAAKVAYLAAVRMMSVAMAIWPKSGLASAEPKTFQKLFKVGWPDGARAALEGSRAILTDKTHANV